MKRDTQGYRVAVVGASSLLGKELLTVLEERGFPVARLITLGPGEEEPELPIVDLDGNLAAKDQAQAVFEQAEVIAKEAEVDFAFLAGRSIRPPSFLSSPDRPERQVVIDLGESGSGPLRESSPVLITIPRRIPSACGRASSYRYPAFSPPSVCRHSVVRSRSKWFASPSRQAEGFCSPQLPPPTSRAHP